MKQIFTSILLLTSILSFSQWVSLNGPGGGSVAQPSFTVRDNGVNPDEVFVYVGDNVYVTTNEGAFWTEALGNGLPYTSSVSLAVSGNYLYAAIPGYSNADAGVFVSTDNGNNWAAANNGLPANAALIKSIIVQGNNVFAGSSYNQGVFVTSDNGQSWTAVNNGLTNKYVYCFYVDGNNLYAGTGNGVFVTSDGGQNWTSVSNGLPANNNINSITKNNAGLFVLAKNISSSAESIYFSGDNGANWTVLNSSFATYFRQLVSDGTNVFLGCFGDGVYITSGSGQTWTQINNGLSGTLVSALLAHNGKVYAGTNMKGINVTDNNGQSWQKSNTGIAATYVTALALLGDSIVTGTNSGLGVFFYSRTNQTWSAGTTQNEIYAVKTHAIGIKGNSIFVGETNGLFYSHDRGQTWAKDLNTGNTITAVTVTNDTIYIGSDNTTSVGVRRSVDNGSTWISVSNGLTTTRVSCLSIGNNVLYAGTSGAGVFKSTDNGANWSAANNGLTDLWVKCIFYFNNYLYVGTGGTPTGGLFVSADGGLNWTAVTTSSGITNLNVRAFTGAGNTVFAAVGAGTIADAGVYVSNDNGATWTYSDIGRHKAVSSLYTDNNYLYAGTNSGGVMKAPLNTVSLTEPLSVNPALQLYPNPAQDILILSSQNISTESPFKIYDISGREVLTGFLSGTQTSLDLKALRKGIYFIKLHAEKHIVTLRFIKI